MNLEDKKKLAELGGFDKRDREGKVITAINMIVYKLANWKAIDHLDDILRGLSDEQNIILDHKINFEIPKKIGLFNVPIQRKYLWFRENPQVVLDLILEVLKEVKDE